MALQKVIMMTINMMGPDLWPHTVVDEIQKVMEEGEAKGKSGWERLPADEHVCRAIEHLKYYEPPDYPHAFERDEDHLAHAFCRLMMAVAIERGYVKGDEDA